MNKIILAAAILGFAFTSTGWAGDMDDKAVCERYAQEDEVTEEKMHDYIAYCLQDLKSEILSEQSPLFLDEEEVMIDEEKPSI